MKTKTPTLAEITLMPKEEVAALNEKLLKKFVTRTALTIAFTAAVVGAISYIDNKTPAENESND